jgi:two-component system phosphate regulon sensor histidine kinase PhoR
MRAVPRLGERAAITSVARAWAILTGMVEGVLVVDSAIACSSSTWARARCCGSTPRAGPPLPRVIRHPAVVAQLAAVRGKTGRIEPAVVTEGSRVSVARAAPVADAHGHGAVLVLHDITYLQRADQIRRDFVANVSHELRTPLTAIRGYVEALGDSPNPDEGRRFLEIIARHTARMERLVNDLLRLARLEGGQELPDYSSCHIESLIGAVVADLQPAIDARRQRVDIRVEPAVATIVGDPAQLHDALQLDRERDDLLEGGRRDHHQARRRGDRFRADRGR